MKKSVQCRLGAGVAIVGASVIALTPIAPASAATPRAIEAQVGLAAIYNQPPTELLALSGQRFVTTVASAPLTPLVAAYVVIAGDENLLRSVVTDAADTPLWALDPVLEALAQIIPDELGGGTGGEPTDGVGDGALLKFRNTALIDLRDDVGDLAEGTAISLQRLIRGLASAPLGVVPVAEGRSPHCRVVRTPRCTWPCGSTSTHRSGSLIPPSKASRACCPHPSEAQTANPRTRPVTVS